MWADELDDVQQHDLIRSYIKRERWKARIMAVEISKIFAPPDKAEPPKPAAKEITTEDFFKMVGAKVVIAKQAE